MKKTLRRVFAGALSMAMLMGMASFQSFAIAADKVHIYLVGDSTGCDYAANADTTYYYKRVGFGTAFKDYLTSDATVTNLALSGRSSKSFLEEANYQTLLKDLENDKASGTKAYLFIAFGHNDEKAGEEARFTDPTGDKDTAGSFQNSLYTNYVLKAQEQGATPVICTPTVRRTPSGNWSDSQLHITNGGDYSAAARNLANELGLLCVDNTELTKALYDTIGTDETTYLHAWTSAKSTSVDNTHLNNYGAHYVAYMMFNYIKSVSDEVAKNSEKGIVGLSQAQSTAVDLAQYIPETIAAPTKEDATTGLIVNPDYKEADTTDLTGDDLNSVLWNTNTAEGWHGSVFGDIGGEDKLFFTNEDSSVDKTKVAIDTATNTPYYNISEGDGTVNIFSGSYDTEKDKFNKSVGKIGSDRDGIAFYYRAVEDTNFELSADITVNRYDFNNQVSFGAMVSDTVMVDKYEAGLMPSYVAAGPIKLAGLENAKKWGNVKADAVVNIDDVALMMQKILKPESIGADVTYDDTVEDVNLDGVVDSKDVTHVSQKVLNSAYNVPAGSDKHFNVFFARDLDNNSALETLGENVDLINRPQSGDTIHVSIVKKGDQVTATYGDYSVTKKLTYSGVVYPGFFTSRAADITVSNIVFNNEVVE